MLKRAARTGVKVLNVRSTHVVGAEQRRKSNPPPALQAQIVGSWVQATAAMSAPSPKKITTVYAMSGALSNKAQPVAKNANERSSSQKARQRLPYKVIVNLTLFVR